MVPRFTFTIAQYDPDRPWLIVHQWDETLEADGESELLAAALVRWPPPGFAVVPSTIRPA